MTKYLPSVFGIDLSRMIADHGLFSQLYRLLYIFFSVDTRDFRTVDGIKVIFDVDEIGGDEDYDRLRPLIYSTKRVC